MNWIVIAGIPEAQLTFHELAYTLGGAFHQNDLLNGGRWKQHAIYFVMTILRA